MSDAKPSLKERIDARAQEVVLSGLRDSNARAALAQQFGMPELDVSDATMKEFMKSPAGLRALHQSLYNAKVDALIEALEGKL